MSPEVKARVREFVKEVSAILADMADPTIDKYETENLASCLRTESVRLKLNDGTSLSVHMIKDIKKAGA